jgi:general secretion pathway protein D
LPPTPPAPAPVPAGGATPSIVFNFDNADVEVVIQAAAEIVGFNYVLAPAARGRKVTVQTLGRIAKDDVFNVLLTILDVNGLTAVKSGNVYRIIPREGAPQSSIRTVVGSEVDPSRPGDEFVTQIVTLKYISAQDAVNLLRPFVAGRAR